VVEQNVLAALDIVERVVVLRSGTIVFDGRSSDLEHKQDLWSYF
jgi:branched-chain amino acid transport system ATP-binding protein